MTFTIEGPDREALLRGLASLPGSAGTGGEPRFSASGSCVLAIEPAQADDLPGLVRLLAGLPFELATLRSPHAGHWEAAGYEPPGFSDGHLRHGWACMFKGAGHDRLVSRRWLEHGPWRLTRLDGDVSLVEFHDLAAAPVTALVHARAGHDRMGVSPSGGFMPDGYFNALDGVYDAEARTYKVPVAVRELGLSEMLDVSTLRAQNRSDTETPIDEAGFAFVMGPDEAQPYIHELWIRELGCWAIIEGYDMRVDKHYVPAAPTPPW
jgi:hypothetical protein